jgi:hypothetical protein
LQRATATAKKDELSDALDDLNRSTIDCAGSRPN